MRNGSRLAPPLAMLVAAFGLAGCLVDRSALTSPPAPLADAAGIDAALPDAPGLAEQDAWSEAPDAFRAEDDAFAPPDASECNFAGEACCPGNVCTSGLRCLGNGVCDAEFCGTTPGGPCCLDGICPGSTIICVEGTCQTCGHTGEPCCAAGSCFSAAEGCDGTNCVPCGAMGQPCCGGSCREGGCADGACRAVEGTRGGPCRFSMMPCDLWAQCQLTWSGGVCEGCGLAGEPCCGSGDACMGTLSCRSRRCS